MQRWHAATSSGVRMSVKSIALKPAPSAACAQKPWLSWSSLIISGRPAHWPARAMWQSSCMSKAEYSAQYSA